MQVRTIPAMRHACRLFALGATLAAGALLGGLAHAQGYPTKPVRVVVAFTAGGTTDILARAVGQRLTEKLKQSFVIDNEPGGGGNIGTEMVVSPEKFGQFVQKAFEKWRTVVRDSGATAE